MGHRLLRTNLEVQIFERRARNACCLDLGHEVICNPARVRVRGRGRKGADIGSRGAPLTSCRRFDASAPVCAALNPSTGAFHPKGPIGHRIPAQNAFELQDAVANWEMNGTEAQFNSMVSVARAHDIGRAVVLDKLYAPCI